MASAWIRSVFKGKDDRTAETHIFPDSAVLAEVQEDQPDNPFCNVQLLEGHADIVRVMVRVDDRRVATASDDGIIIVWNVQDGSRMETLLGHTKPVTCMIALTLDGLRLLSASIDRSIRVWDPSKGQCTLTLSTTGDTVKCIEFLASSGMLCGAGESLYIWNRQGHLVQQLLRPDMDSPVHSMIALRHEYVAVLSDSILPEVYAVERSAMPSSAQKQQHQSVRLQFFRVLSGHRESVRCIHSLSDSEFATGSLDGTVIIWSSDSLSLLHRLNFQDSYYNRSHDFVYSVQCLISYQHFLFATIGCGFHVYNYTNSMRIFVEPKAHLSKIEHMVFLPRDLLLVICSLDSTV
jgi:WD40 repeat protein